MKKNLTLFAVALLSAAATLGGYKVFEDKETGLLSEPNRILPVYNTSLDSNAMAVAAAVDFTQAAERSIDAVVHVTNTSNRSQPTNIMDFFYGGGNSRPQVGTGSGVIISKDGYIVTNNHVIENASELEVTLNNNQTYAAELIGTDPKSDIALIKIDPPEDLPYMTFGDSNQVRVGEWVLAVGNPFNLTSTVTAGIVSAKARELSQFDTQSVAFIQTDAAVNRGNSGGALVNTSGQLIGINTAITSQTGSYVGYSFAVPSNNAKKVIQDILEYGNVQRGILGIRAMNAKDAAAQLDNVSETEGVYVSSVENNGGDGSNNLMEGDIIKELDGVKIAKFTDLAGYLGSKRPNDVVNVTIVREGDTKTVPITLMKLETFELDKVGIEVKNAGLEKLKDFNLDYGLEVTRALTRDMSRYNWASVVITKINDEQVKNIEDLKQIINNLDPDDPIKMTVVTSNGEVDNYIIR